MSRKPESTKSRERGDQFRSPTPAERSPRDSGASLHSGRPDGPLPSGAPLAVLLTLWLIPVGAPVEAQVSELTPVKEEGREEVQEAVVDTTDPVYTWRDGDRTLSVWLQSDLTMREEEKIQPRDQVVSRISGVFSVVRLEAETNPETKPGSGNLPVFRSRGGELMALPGGVLIVFDSSWSEIKHAGFFESKGIEPQRVSRSEALPFLYVIETGPGFPSLELANALAEEPGVELSTPNWWIERQTR